MKNKNRDEMEQSILIKSENLTYRFMTIALSMWVLIGLFLKKSVVLPGYILLAQLFIRFIAEQIYKKEVDDERWKRNVIVFLVSIVIIIFVAMLGATMFVAKVDA